MQQYLLRALVALVLTVTLLGQGTLVLAGTTGGLSGTVVSGSDRTPVAAVKVTVSSPSAQQSTLTDAAGKFTFISLPPDTYTVSIEKAGFDPVATSGVTVVSDSTATANLTTQKTIKTIGRITSRASGDLVKAGQTADVYSVNAATQAAVSAVGGGGGLNNAYSAIATVPGAIVPFNQNGWFQTVHVRGGDYDQTGYELDGIPVNRSFDNYPSGAASSLGQQELQIYTGSTPATAEGVGLAGYINQVIRTGTYPGFTNLAGGIGGAAFYHKASFETGGASKNRNFSYYVGVGGYNQSFRYIDNNNGASVDKSLGTIIDVTACPTTVDPNNAACYASGIGPGGYIYAPYNIGTYENIQVRNTVANVHFGIPHKNGEGKDDIQLLYINDLIVNDEYSSANDFGGALQQACVSGLNLGGACSQYTNPVTGVASGPYQLAYVDGYQYNGARGTALASNYQSLTQNYFFPSSSGTRAFNGSIGSNIRDEGQNSQSIFKAQYQHNFGSSAYLRVYGYTYYSTYLGNGPNSTFLYKNALSGAGQSRDYELSSHTRGVSATFSDQLNDKNLLTLQSAFTTATTLRNNNRQINDGSGYRSRFAVAVDPNAPTNGICYKVTGTTSVARPCDPSIGGGSRATWATLPQAAAGTIAPISGATCGTGACQYFVAETGPNATYNTVKPRFSNFAITDEFKPTAKITINAGLRYDNFQFTGSDTQPNDPARSLFVNGFNAAYCETTPGLPLVLNKTPNVPCSTVFPGSTNANFQNTPSQKFSYGTAQPRIGATYALSADTVLRASYGSYVQAPSSAFEQYNALQANLPSIGGFQTFYKLGFHTPGHAVRPPISYNVDASLEHHFKGSDTSFKLTPFKRKTRDQIQNFFLDQQSAFVSGLNVGRQTSQGIELAVTKGDFARDGLSASFAFTYTNSFINYSKLANGSTVIDGVNSDIKTYNQFTSYCATHPGDAKYGCSSTVTAAPCYDTAGNPLAACAAGSVANPYYNAPVQSLFDPNANYPTYDLLVGGIGSAAGSFNVPYSATLVLNYRKNRLAVTPSLQFQGGTRYGSPQSTPGIDPRTCAATLGSAISNDPRYKYGGTGSPYDATSCAGDGVTTFNNIVIPSSFSGTFDSLGAYVQPSEVLANMNISYAATKSLSFNLTLANLYHTCFGGSKTGFTQNDNKVCSYGIVQGGNLTPTGNFYNPGNTIEKAVAYPYQANYGGFNTDGNSTRTPFTVYLDAKLKL